MNLELLKFIHDNANWRTLLTEKPYCITIKEDDNYMIFNYNQPESDFYNPIVRECRGIILRKDNYKPVCVPFFKFGNYGESYIDKIDWNTAVVEEKVDGSLIKFWYDDGLWHISTNGTIDAYEAPLSNNVKYKSFGELAESAMPISIEQFNAIADKSCTYMFELVSPYNRVVVPYKETILYLIGLRDNRTLQEYNPYWSTIRHYFYTPKIHALFSLDDCIKTANELPFDEEGYVVVDQYFHRNKIKSPAWVAVHHMINNGNINQRRIVELIMSGEEGEFLTYYPEYAEDFNHIADRIKKWEREVTKAWMSIQPKLTECETRKEVAQIIMATNNAAVYFTLFDKKSNSVNDWLHKQSADKILTLIGE